jgi:membrane protein YqaA with SNARE-associated domain
MNILRSVLAVIVGAVLGGVVNMTIVVLGPRVIPVPAGVDMTTAEGVAAAMPLLEPKHFIAPFLAHALGTLVGAIVAYLIAANYKNICAYIVGVLFLIGGITACFLIPAPAWFMSLDLIVAYIPMAWLGIMIGRKMQRA